MEALANIERGRNLPNLSWINPQQIMERRIEQGFEKRESEEAEAVAMKLKASRSWVLQKQLRCYSEFRYGEHSENFFGNWQQWVNRCRLKSFKRVTGMLIRRMGDIPARFRNRNGNNVAEGYYSWIQAIKPNFRGFRNFNNCLRRILFLCGNFNCSRQ